LGRPETDIAVDEISWRRAAERELEALRAELAEQVAARHEVQVRLEEEIAQRDRVIAEGARTEARLREREMALRQLFDEGLDSMTIIDLETGRYIDVNEEYARNSGYSRKEVIGKRSRELVSFVNAEENGRLVAELKRAGLVRNMEATFYRKDGSTYCGLISALNLKLSGHLCCVTMSRDIGALKETQRQLIAAREAALEASRAKDRIIAESAQTEARLRESESALRQIFDQNLDSMTITDLETGRFIDVNEEYLRNSGNSREDVVGKRSREVQSFKYPEENLRYVDEIRRAGVVRNMEATFRRKDGSTYFGLISALNLKLRGHLCCISMSRDIGAVKETQCQLIAAREAALEASRAKDRIIAEGELTQARLRESETALRQLFDQNLDSMMILDLETGKYIDVNEEYTRNTGYSREEVIGQRSRELRSFVNLEENERLSAELKRVGVVRNLEATFCRKDGSTYFGLISAINLKFRGHLCCITITRDIAALKETQHQLIAAREAALEGSRAKSDFLSSMSHEIRTPMNAVLGMADMLWESDLTEEQRRYLDIMRNNGATLLDLINDILDLAKVESGQLRFEEVDFDIRELVDKAAETMGMRAHEKQLELAGHVADDVPHNLVGDPLRLRQVIVNLLSNAIKFTDRGEIVLSVEMMHPDTGTGAVSIRFSVTDTGIGIPRDKTDSIFGAFNQADSSTTRKYGGTGLGLTIVKRLVEMYHGQISVESEVGKGSCFSFSAEFKTRPAPATVALPAARVDLAGMRILVVDDTAVNRMILREALTSQDALVTCVESGQAALDEIDRAAARGNSYRAVLLDYRMPAMDGVEVARQIRRRWLEPHDRPIILMLTSDDLGETMVRARAVGVEIYMIKPIRRADLFEALSRALGAAVASPTTPSPAGRAGADSTPGADVFDQTRSLRILLADDSRDNRLLVQAYFKKTPYILDEVEDGAAAVEKFRTGIYDLVLMDIEMPIMDGYSATRAIRAMERETGRRRIPIIALTASVLEAALKKALDAGCDAHVAKPVKRVTLLAAVHKAMRDAEMDCGAPSAV
jgi:PAS domain S-box-containing protein